jgi:dihydroorotase
MFTSNPAKLLGLNDPTVASGSPANLSLFDPQIKWTYDSTAGFSKSTNSPFHGRRIRGKTVFTLYNGQVVFQDEVHANGRFKQESISVN